MHERMQHDLAGQIQDAVESKERRRAQGLKDLAKRFARADARGFFVSDVGPEVATPVEGPTVHTKLTTATFHDYLIEDLKSRGQEIALPKPSAEIVKVYNILAGEGYEVAPIAFVDGKKREVRIGVFETVVRPDYTDGSQMYYSPRPDPAAGILKRGRTENPQRIVFPYGNASEETRFYVSWKEIHDYVVPEARKTTPHLEEQLAKGGIVLDIPDLADFRSAGKTHNLEAYSWEWVQDSARFGSRCVAGHRDGGVSDWPPGGRRDDVGFRFEAVSRPQKLPR